MVAALKAKSRDSFDYLYDNYSEVLFGVINRIVQSDEIANDILEIKDNPESIKLLLPKDFIISYNLSNILRDYDSLSLIKSTDYVNFYDSRDFPIPNFDEFKNSLNVSLDELLNTYENVNTLEIDSAFKKIAQGKE